VIKNGDRIAQMVISKYEQISFSLTESLDETERGEGGYGHTGI
jgi:dUTP pyrophosphatase